MKCPFCKGKKRTKVVDSRISGKGYVIRRRRECPSCKRRYTTYERMEAIPLRVIKKDGNRVAFERQKVLNGLIKACEKRPVATQTLANIVDQIEFNINQKSNREITSKEIGQMVMQALEQVDKVAYVRFASVYHEFDDPIRFMDEVKNISHK